MLFFGRWALKEKNEKKSRKQSYNNIFLKNKTPPKH